MFVAPPAFRKSATMNFGTEILEELTGLNKAPTITSQAALQSVLASASDSSLYIVSEEFSDFIMKSGQQMFEWLTSMFDAKKYLAGNTLSRGAELVTSPCVNLLAATTPVWISRNMSEEVIGGGFASRVIFVYEDSLRQRQMYYTNVDQNEIARKRDNLIKDLQHIADNIEGEFEIDDLAKEYMEEWYSDNADYYGDNNNLRGYYGRKPTHIHKIAMLLHIARSDELVIEKQDFIDAIGMLEKIERNLIKTFKSVGLNDYKQVMADMYEYIAKKGLQKERVMLVQLRREFMNAAPPDILDKLIVGLTQAELIVQKLDDSGRSYFEVP